MPTRQKNRKTIAILTATIFAAGIGMTVPEPANAGKKTTNLLLGAAAGAAGLAILHSLNKKKKRAAQPAPPVYYAPPRRYTPRPRRNRYYAPRPQRPRAVFSQQTMQIQQSLGALGYNVGVADGLMGRSTRAGVRQFQVSIGQPATGYLSPSQKGILFQRAQGGAVIPTGYPVVARPVVPAYQPPVYTPPAYQPPAYQPPAYTPPYTGRPAAPVYPPTAAPTAYLPRYPVRPTVPAYTPRQPITPAYMPPAVRGYSPGTPVPPRPVAGGPYRRN